MTLKHRGLTKFGHGIITERRFRGVWNRVAHFVQAARDVALIAHSNVVRRTRTITRTIGAGVDIAIEQSVLASGTADASLVL